MLNITVLMPFEVQYREQFTKAAGDAVIRWYDAPADCPECDLLDADVVIGNPPADLLPRMTRLKWIQLRMAGTEPYSKPGVLDDSILLTNATGAFGHAISEHMVAATLTLMKKLHLYRDNQNRSQWLDRGTVPSITKSTVLVVGMGDIGGEYAKRMKALGAYVIGVRRADTNKPDYVDELHLTEKLDELIPRADIIALALPNTPATAKIINAERLALLKDGAYIINVGRGNAIDTEALCDCALSGRLGGAALDVTDPEPLPSDHRMWGIENILITPHVSGFFHMRETYENMVGIMIENVRRFASGDMALENIIDKSTGYRKLK